VISEPMIPGLCVSHWTQRNWSRVGVGVDHDGNRRFVKQFVDARGRRLQSLFEAEQRTCDALAQHRFGALVPLAPLAAHPGSLALVYPYIDELSPLDVQARTASPTGLTSISTALEGLVGDLWSLARAEQSRQGREDQAPEGALGWKGLDIKNLSLLPDGRLLGFDFGPLYRAPLADPVARLVASVLVANWGRPLHRSLTGPPGWSLAVVSRIVGATTRADVDRRLERLLTQRLAEPQRIGVIERALVGPLTRTLGPRYWADCRAWVDRHLNADSHSTISTISTISTLESPPWQPMSAQG
jgi:hypothetical protein